MKKDQSPRSFSSSEQYPDTGESGDVYDEEAIHARDENARRPDLSGSLMTSCDATALFWVGVGG